MTATEFRFLRAASGLSSRTLAAALGVQNSTVYRWEHGARRIPSEIADHLRRLASTPAPDSNAPVAPPTTMPAPPA